MVQGVFPPDLMEMMRHESIETTMKYYVGRNAQTTAKRLWDAYREAQEGSGTTQGTTRPNPAPAERETPP